MIRAYGRSKHLRYASGTPRTIHHNPNIPGPLWEVLSSSANGRTSLIADVLVCQEVCQLRNQPDSLALSMFTHLTRLELLADVPVRILILAHCSHLDCAAPTVPLTAAMMICDLNSPRRDVCVHCLKLDLSDIFGSDARVGITNGRRRNFRERVWQLHGVRQFA